MLRVLLITDSLGCPREEVPVDFVWTDKIIKEFAGKVIFYTYCVRGLSARIIDLEWVKNLGVDCIIMQIGIVDACRRALTKPEYMFFSRIPVVSGIVHRFCDKHHFFMTRIRNKHLCSKAEFCDVVVNASGSCNSLYFIKIADPGKLLVEETYRVLEDVNEYNRIVQQQAVNFLDPYQEFKELLLQDGHHLNNRGQQKVFECVQRVIEGELSKHQKEKED